MYNNEEVLYKIFKLEESNLFSKSSCRLCLCHGRVFRLLDTPYFLSIYNSYKVGWSVGCPCLGELTNLSEVIEDLEPDELEKVIWHLNLLS